MSDELKTNLTAAKLKALCILNDLATSGNKSTLIQRLLDAGIKPEDIGLESQTDNNQNAGLSSEDDSSAELSLSLEDEDTLTPEIEPKPRQMATAAAPINEALDAEVLDAEVLDADFVSLEERVKEPKIGQPSITESTSNNPLTLLEMVKQPKIAAIILVLLILGAGSWYYFNKQLEPFTADSLRYGDEMTYTISDGEFSVTDEFLDIFLDQIDTDQDLCKLAFSDSKGIGNLKITKGDSEQLSSQSSLDRVGAVTVRDGMGSNWLAVETAAAYDFSKNEDLTIAYSYPINVGITESCEVAGTLKPKIEINSKKWNELKSRNTLRNEVLWNLDAVVEGEFKQYEGHLNNFGVGGIFGDLEAVSPGFSMLLQPVELQDLIATDYIDEGVTGSRLGWDWRVLGSETLGSTEMWKIVANNQDIQEFCLGSASMTLLVEEGNPWATKQTVNVVISGSDSNRQGCSTTSKLLGDYVLPDGELTMSHTFQKSSLSRGSKALEYGYSYDARPQANELTPNDDQLNNWGPNGLHFPDESLIRQHNLESAIQCIDNFQTSAAGAYAALDNDGYVWRAIDQQFNQSTQWNISWIASDNTVGWVTFNITGSPSAENCQFDKKGTYDDSVSYNREFIPPVLNLSTIETSLQDTTRFSALTGNDGLYTNSGTIHSETRIGYLVVVPGSGINSILSNIGDATDGATTVDISRQWSDNEWNKRLNVLIDATDGRIIGWNYVMNT